MVDSCIACDLLRMGESGIDYIHELRKFHARFVVLADEQANVKHGQGNDQPNIVGQFLISLQYDSSSFPVKGAAIPFRVGREWDSFSFLLRYRSFLYKKRTQSIVRSFFEVVLFIEAILEENQLAINMIFFDIWQKASVLFIYLMKFVQINHKILRLFNVSQCK